MLGGCRSKNRINKFIKTEFQIIFVDNYDDFKKNISNGVYPVIALSIAHKNLNCLQSLLQNFSNHKFRIIVDVSCFYDDVINAFTDADRKYRNFTTNELIEDFIIKTIAK
jgi:phosphoribosylformimino-5-aminoimidazole carboxamide ribonucleotide (ProFAR) isomerase